MNRTFIFILLVFSFIKINAQSIAPSILNSSGGFFQSGYYQFEWSIGESTLVGEMNSANNSYFITNGFLQPFTQFPAKNNTNNIFADDEIKVFPNPASSYVEIDFLTKQQGRIVLNFYDGSGRKVYTVAERYYGNGLIKRIPVSQLPNEVYMLHVDLDPNPGSVHKKGVYKIIKIK